MKLSRTTGLYRYLDFAFNLYAHFHRVDKWWHSERGLEKSDFCRIVRIACVYVPLIVSSQIVMLSGAFYLCIIKPLTTSVDVLGVLLPLFVMTTFLAVLAIFTVTYLTVSNWVETSRRKKFQKEMEAVAADFGKPYNPAEKTPNTTMMFIKNIYKAVKDRFCPIISFKE